MERSICGAPTELFRPKANGREQRRGTKNQGVVGRVAVVQNHVPLMNSCKVVLVKNQGRQHRQQLGFERLWLRCSATPFWDSLIPRSK